MGTPCADEGEELPLHGTIGNTPCERIWWDEDNENLYIHAEINDSRIFGRKLRLSRLIAVRKKQSIFTITDTVTNGGDAASPFMLLYHFNMGYPLLSENAIVTIPSCRVTPRTEHAAEDLASWDRMLRPTAGFEEQCYYHTFAGEGSASVYNPDIGKGLGISFDPKRLDHFTEWKMMGVRDYVLGLEPGNCHPDGRNVMRREGRLKFLQSGERISYEVKLTLYGE